MPVQDKVHTLDALIEESGQDILACYQCLKCTSGCPAFETGNYMPNQLIRELQCGELESVLESDGLWSCLGCGTCGLRCPNNIAVDHVVDVLREWALESRTQQGNIEHFHDAFLKTIRSYGRVHELTMIARYKLASRDLFSDIGSGLTMFRKGKIPLVPSRIRGLQELRRLFSVAEGAGGEKGE